MHLLKDLKTEAELNILHPILFYAGLMHWTACMTPNNSLPSQQQKSDVTQHTGFP